MSNLEMQKKSASISPELAAEYAEDAKENLLYVNDAFYRLSIQGGRYKVEGNIIGFDGIRFEAVILKYIPVNLYYEGAYDPSKPSSPDCWSLGGQKPDVSVMNKQAENCLTCKQNKFGSALSFDGKKRSKACNNTRRLVLKVEGVDLPVVLNLPPTSIKAFNKYLKELTSGNLPIPMFGVITEFGFDTSVQYPKPIMKIVRPVEPEKYHHFKEYRNSTVVENALHAYAADEDFLNNENNHEEEDDVKF